MMMPTGNQEALGCFGTVLCNDDDDDPTIHKRGKGRNEKMFRSIHQQIKKVEMQPIDDWLMMCHRKEGGQRISLSLSSPTKE
jgi:hypothetical protein